MYHTSKGKLYYPITYIDFYLEKTIIKNKDITAILTFQVDEWNYCVFISVVILFIISKDKHNEIIAQII